MKQRSSPVLLFFLGLCTAATPSWVQRGGSSGGGGQPGAPGLPGRQPQQQQRMQGPVYISGRVIVETGRPAAEAVSLELSCGARAMQVIHTDLGGYFTFTLGTGAPSNLDFTASSDAPMVPGTRDSMADLTGVRNNNMLTG